MRMDVRNCRTCGGIFNYVSGPITCPACREKLEEKFQEVKSYIQGHKGAGIPEVAEACEVDVAQIRQWLREERLELSAEVASGIECESCGKPIRSGKFCEKCSQDMAKGFQDLLKTGKHAPAKPARQEGEGPKMRFLK